jgi:hypothetical protein
VSHGHGLALGILIAEIVIYAIVIWGALTDIHDDGG